LQKTTLAYPSKPAEKQRNQDTSRTTKYAPELNEIEPVWRDLKAHHLAHQTFTDIAALDHAIHDAVINLNRERIPNPLAMPRISA
jgi:transposase